MKQGYDPDIPARLSKRPQTAQPWRTKTSFVGRTGRERCHGLNSIFARYDTLKTAKLTWNTLLFNLYLVTTVRLMAVNNATHRDAQPNIFPGFNKIIRKQTR